MWGNGSSYVGQWKEDRRCGIGKYTWPQGDIYEGEFLDSHRHGQGTYTWPDGRRYTGYEPQLPLLCRLEVFYSTIILTFSDSEWKNGPRNGKGTYYWPDGSSYVGEWRDSKRHGAGTFYWASGERWTGQWRDDLRAGCERECKPWDGFCQSIDEMRRNVLDYMAQIKTEKPRSSVDVGQ